jgi:YHS domain-containing protein
MTFHQRSFCRVKLRDGKTKCMHPKTNYEKTFLAITALALLAGAPALVRAADTNAPTKPYPLNYCLVSGDKIGDMGKPVTTNYLGQEIIFCCPDCVKDFNKDPKKYMKKLEEAQKKNAADK